MSKGIQAAALAGSNPTLLGIEALGRGNGLAPQP